MKKCKHAHPYQYTIPCSDCGTNVDYTEPMIRDIVSQGLADKDIQLKLLGDANQSPSLEEVLQFVEKKEFSKRSAPRLSTPHYSAAASSTYRRQQRGSVTSNVQKPQAQAVQPPDTSDPCMYCGKHGDGTKASAHIRSKQCPAYRHAGSATSKTTLAQCAKADNATTQLLLYRRTFSMANSV